MSKQQEPGTAKKGLLRIVFSRTGIILLLLLVQIAIMFGSIYYLHEYIHYVYGTTMILQVVVLIYLINAEGNPAFKMTLDALCAGISGIWRGILHFCKNAGGHPVYAGPAGGA